MRSEPPPIGLVIAVLAGLLAFGCAEKPAVNETSKEGTEPARPAIIRIIFNLPGDDIGSSEDQAILDALRNAVVGSQAGEIVSSGFGMGTMEMVVVIDSYESTKVMRRIVDDVYPKAKYRIVAGAPKSVQSPSNGGRTVTPQ
jgi:hypothetical protein